MLPQSKHSTPDAIRDRIEDNIEDAITEGHSGLPWSQGVLFAACGSEKRFRRPGPLKPNNRGERDDARVDSEASATASDAGGYSLATILARERAASRDGITQAACAVGLVTGTPNAVPSPPPVFPCPADVQRRHSFPR
jgi:hypothetical protein